MVKHFNSAVKMTSTGSSPKKGGGSTILVFALIGLGLYLGYKYIQKNNVPAIVEDED